MPLPEKKYDIETNNDWAKNTKGEHIYILDAQSGRKGYYCIGCDKQMDAVIKKKNPRHKSFFRHVPVDISKGEIPCSFNNRKYREILATDILQRLKRIKVPALYKYPPKGSEGHPMPLKKTTFIKASTVRAQLTFYEDNEGNIKYGKNPNVEDRYLLIRPDIAFFNEKNIPILLIELVVTHKIDDLKRAKLRRIGIDTISVIIPKSSEQEIEDNFKTTKRVKWEYNEIEANTEYIYVPFGTTEGILELDEQQRKLFEESYSCRKNRINNTIRTIKKCLGTQLYRRTEHLFKSEISRIENATKQAERELEELERSYDEEIFSSFTGEHDSLEQEERRFRIEEKRFQKYTEDLENRYFNKTEEIRIKQNTITNLREQKFEINYSEEQLREQFRIKKRELEQEFNIKTRGVKNDIEYEKGNLEQLNKEERDLSSQFKQIEKQERRRLKKERTELKKKHREIKRKIDEFGEYTSRTKENLESEFKRIGDESVERINQRDSSGSSGLSKRIETILDVRRISSNFGQRQSAYQRHKSHLKLIRGRTWKK